MQNLIKTENNNYFIPPKFYPTLLNCKKIYSLCTILRRYIVYVQFSEDDLNYFTKKIEV